jgi:hypothetical protein
MKINSGFFRIVCGNPDQKKNKKKKLRTQINGKFNAMNTANENK